MDNKKKSKCSLYGLNDLSIDAETEKKILSINLIKINVSVLFDQTVILIN